jgi:LuxR family transcriptional regulator, maltose regulon positive regulatory protein
VIKFWSAHVLSKSLPQSARIMVFGAASLAAIRLEALAEPNPDGIGTRARLSPRELAVLRLVSMGNSFKEIAAGLKLGEETVRTHLKNAQAKLGVHNRAHAVAEAMRQDLIL